MKKVLPFGLFAFIPIFFLLSSFLSAENRNVLVTGGAGYIGSHTCKLLKEAGYLPITYDSLIEGDERIVSFGPFVKGDLLDQDLLDETMRSYHPIAVIHFAALKKVPDSVKDPKSYYRNNVVGTLNLLESMVKHGIPYIVFSSSCSVYGDVDEGAIVESQEQKPASPYAYTKSVNERMIQDFSKAYPLEYRILRYFNVAGIDPKIGMRRDPKALYGLIPRTLAALLDPSQPLLIFGDDYPTRDGTAIRDYIHVQDLAFAHILSLEQLLLGLGSDEFNLGTGRGCSVLEVVQAVEKVALQKVPCHIVPRREGDIVQAVADVKKAQEKLHFFPKCSDLETIIESEWLDLQLQKVVGE